DVLTDHVVFEVECIDRMYLNTYIPGLQYEPGLVAYVHVRQWTTTISIGLRLLPMLREECAVVLKMISQRVDSGPVRRSEAVRNRRDQIVHGIVLCCATAVRRSAEMGDAITARGGLGTVAHIDRRPGRRDALVLLGAVAVLAAGILT